MARELMRETSGAGKIGTTGKGIGPAYEDKVARRALRVQDLKHPERFAAKLRELLELHNFALEGWLHAKALDVRADLRDGDARRRGAPADDRPTSATTLYNAHRGGANLLFEGAQGTLLDIDHGTYPFVTSSNCVAGNAAAGSGVGPDLLHYILGITKAYTHARRRRPVPDRAAIDEPGTSATTCRPSARSAAPSPAGRAAAAGSTRRCSSARSSSTASRACASPSSTSSTA